MQIQRMQIQVNGQPFTIPETAAASPAAPVTLAALLHVLALDQVRCAVEINGELVPRTTHATHVLQAGDRVEIVRAIGGG